MAVFGETLRQARAYKGVTLKEAEQATRINRHHLAALEDENFLALPPLIYQRGIVRNYATYLDLDPNRVLTMFEEAHGDTAATRDPVVASKPLDMPSHFTPNFAIIAFLVVLSAIVFAWVYSLYRGPDSALPTPTMQTTVTPLATRNMAQPVNGTVTVTVTPTSDPNGTPIAASPVAGGHDASSSVATDEARRPLSEANQRRTQVAQQQASGTMPSSTETVAGAAPSASAPTATQASQPNVRADQTAPTATSVPVDTPTLDATEAPEVDTETTSDTQAAPATEDTVDANSVTLSFSPEADIYLTVIGDGTVLWDGNVSAGQVVGPFSASSFNVYTSDPSQTNITNEDTGETFYMGTSSFTLP